MAGTTYTDSRWGRKRRIVEYDEENAYTAPLTASLMVDADEHLAMTWNNPASVEDVGSTFNAMLKELRKMNVYLALITDTWLDNADVEGQ